MPDLTNDDVDDVVRLLDLLRGVVQALVPNEDEVFVGLREVPDGFQVEVHVAPDDFGYIIGRQGATAQALTRLWRAWAGNLWAVDARVHLDLTRPEDLAKRQPGDVVFIKPANL